MVSDHLSIHELMPQVMAAVGAVAKARETSGQGPSFKFRGIEDVLAKVQPALARDGVYIVPHQSEVLNDERYQTKGGAQMRNVQVRTTFRAYGPAGDYVQFQALGEGSDAGDKATAKALSIAQKYALFQAFSIPTEDQAATDPDAQAHEREGAGSADAQARLRADLDDLSENDPERHAEVRRYMRENRIGWPMSESQMTQVWAVINA